MRIARKASLSGMVVLATMVVSAGSASALEVADEATGDPCLGCPIEMHGEVELLGFPFGVEAAVSDCIVELSGTIDHSGEGEITATNGFLDHSSTNSCVVTPCDLPWPAHLSDGPTGQALDLELCMATGSSDARCAVTLPLVELGHFYTWSGHVEGEAHGAERCGLEGVLSFEGQSIEVGEGSPTAVEVVDEAAGTPCVRVVRSRLMAKSS